MSEPLTGEWIYQAPYHWYQCSKCHKVYQKRMLEEYFDTCQYMPRFRYCPNCGSYNGDLGGSV